MRAKQGAWQDGGAVSWCPGLKCLLAPVSPPPEFLPLSVPVWLHSGGCARPQQKVYLIAGAHHVRVFVMLSLEYP